MKRVLAIALAVVFAAIGSGCISIHKETHEAAYMRDSNETSSSGAKHADRAR